MAKNNIKNDAITPRDENFAQWYTDICKKAELMDYSSVKGFIVYLPNSYALWENIQDYMNQLLKKTGHQNVYMPLVIPQSLLQKEADHVEGFAPECAMITKGGFDELEEPLIVRPTSETLFCEYYAKAVRSYRDLPKLYNQWCSVVRWEKTTRPFLRGSEFLWQEGHTVHATEEEARKETLYILYEVYNKTARDLLAIPMITGQKTEREKFAGAVDTYTMEALMHDGKALQSGTTHYFGTGFAEAFGMQFQDKDNTLKYMHQTSWGASTRLLGAIIMVHGDDNGLVLPPRVAPTQLRIIPIQQKKAGVLDAAYKLRDELTAQGIRVDVDDSDKSPGWKFSDAEVLGIPLRLEIGPRDLENNQCVIVKRVNGEKVTLPIDDKLGNTIKEMFDDIHNLMYDTALKFTEEHTTEVDNYDDFKEVLENKGGYVKMPWCGDEACEVQIKEETTATSRCIDLEAEPHGTCPICGKQAKHIVYFAKAY